ncbi:MAG: hypothetical protein ACI4UM_00960 [Succinivibrio sp.]
MKIAVINADGKFGSSIVKKAEEQKIGSVSIVDSFTAVSGNGRLVIKKVNELTLNDIADCHYIIDPVSFIEISRFSSDDLPVWHLLEILKDTSVRLLTLAPSSILFTDRNRTRYVGNEDSDLYLDEKERRASRLCLNAYRRLSLCTNVRWSVLCHPLFLDPLSYGSGKFAFFDEVLPVGLKGESTISENDFTSSVIELLKMIPKEHSCTSVRELRE